MLNEPCVLKWLNSLTVVLVIGVCAAQVNAQITVDSLIGLRLASENVNNSTITLTANGGDPHPVTGVVTAGEYWINGDHILNPTSSEPTFLELMGNGNTYHLGAANINLDTRKLDGFGRALGHDSGIEVVKVSGSNNTVNGLNVTGHDLALDTDPSAQRHADWAAVYVQLTGTDNTMNGTNVLSRGSSPYGLGDAFGKGARSFPQGEPASEGGHPWVGHNKTSAFQVTGANGAVIDDMHLDVRTYGHGFFVQVSDDTTLTNSTVTGELFPSTNVSSHPKYIEYGGITKDGNPIPEDIFISGAEDGVRMYTGASNLTVDNVVVTNMRSGFAVALGSGSMNLNNVESYGAEHAFDFKSNTTITNAKGDIVNGPLVWNPYSSTSNSSIDVELVGQAPVGHDWAAAFISGNNVDVTISSDLPAGALGDDALIRFGQRWWNDWRDHDDLDNFDQDAFDYINSTFHNNTNQMLVLGNDVTGNDGSSQGGVVSNGKNNEYDGVTFVFGGTRLTAQHVNGLGNGGEANAGTLDSNGTIVSNGSTLEVQPGISITDEKLVISGDGVDGKGALYSNGQSGSGTRFGSSNSGDESTIFLDGDASIGVGNAGSQLLVGRIQGTGNLTKRGAGMLAMEKSSTYVGDLIVAEGRIEGRSGVVHNNLTVAAGASIAAISANAFATPNGAAQIDGTLDLNGRTSTFLSNISGTLGLLNGSGRITSSAASAGSGGTLTLAGSDADGQYAGDIDGNVTLIKVGDNNQTLSGFLSHTGTTTVNGGGLYVDGSHSGGGDYTVNAGTLGGAGSISSNVTVNNVATLAPGGAGSDDFGLLTLLGAYSQAAGSTLAFDIENGLTYDRLSVGGSASLAGTLELTSTDPSQYTLGNFFALVNAGGGVSGAFDSIDGVSVGSVNGIDSGLAVLYGPQSVSAIVAMMGDANLDQQVDVLSDAALLVQNLGMSTGATWMDGDFNGDGAVDVLGDAALLISNLGAGSSGSSPAASAVPEPTSAVILIALALPCMFQRRRR